MSTPQPLAVRTVGTDRHFQPCSRGDIIGDLGASRSSIGGATRTLTVPSGCGQYIIRRLVASRNPRHHFASRSLSQKVCLTVIAQLIFVRQHAAQIMRAGIMRPAILLGPKQTASALSSPPCRRGLSIWSTSYTLHTVQLPEASHPRSIRRQIESYNTRKSRNASRTCQIR